MSSTGLRPHDHVVNFYDADTDLVAAVGRFIGEGIVAHEVVVVIATAAHHSGFCDWLTEHGVDLGSATTAGRFIPLDASAVLGRFMVDGWPDEERFRETIEPYLRDAACDGADVRAFGEMVALLWNENNVGAAVEVERLWNALSAHHSFSLYCAYPAAALAGCAELEAAAQVCAQHSELIAPVSYDAGGTVSRADADHVAELFIPTTGAIAAARRFVAATLRAWSRSELIDAAMVVASELATNALLHANGPFRVLLTHERGCVRLGIEDGSSLTPVIGLSGGETVDGRGLAIVNALAASWGSDRCDTGKVVWATLA